MIGTGIGLGLSGYRLKTGPSTIPESIGGLQLWLDASDASTLYQSSGGSSASADGDPIGYWQDKSSSSFNVIQSDGTKKPALKTAIKNGKNVVRFDGVNDFFASSNNFGLSNSSQFSLFVVAKLSTSSQYATLFSQHSASGVYKELACGVPQISGNSKIAVDTWQPSGVSGSTIIGNSSFYLFEFVFDTWSSMTTTGQFYLNSVQETRSTYGSPIANLMDGLLYIGSFGPSLGTGFWTGDIAEIVFYNSALSNSNRQLIESYLNAKWSIY